MLYVYTHTHTHLMKYYIRESPQIPGMMLCFKPKVPLHVDLDG
jgi:hypothetical protein